MEPLANRIRPKTLDDFYGQEHIVGKDKLLYRMITSDRLSSIILWGPTGTGKTSLARVIANTTNYKFVELNATNSGVGEIKNIVAEAQNRLINPKGKVVLFLDEIHRFNKAQQDTLLPYVENGTIILIGATTENPYFEVNKALISRSTVFKLRELDNEDIEKIIKKTITDKENGLGNYNIKIEEEAINYLALLSNGDVRTALNGLEIAVLSTNMDENGNIIIDKHTVEESVQQRKVLFDKSGDSHYDNISAMIKSMRGSDPDAAIFYLARAIEGGEDPMFLARRIVICASEDVGMANSQALAIATAAMQATEKIGMPEARIILAHAVTYVAESPKSNAVYLGIDQALSDVREIDTGTIPMHIRNNVASGMEEEGYGVGYKYPHNFENNYIQQQYLPDKIKDKKYYIKKTNEEILNIFNKKEG